MRNLVSYPLVVGLLVTTAVSLQASERYAPRPQPRPAPVAPQPAPPSVQPAPGQAQPGPAARRVRVILREKFDPGQQIFTGQVKLGDADPRLLPLQEPRLKELQAQLPKDVQVSAKLPEMAGKLTEKQLGALEYFLLMRYNASVRTKGK